MHGPGLSEACWQAQALVPAVQAQLLQAASICLHLQPSLLLLQRL